MAQPSKIADFFRKYSFIWIGLLVGMVVVSAVFPPLLVANVALIGLALIVQVAIIVGSILAGGAIGGFIGQLARLWKMNFSKESLLAKWNYTWDFEQCLKEVLPRMEVKDSTEKDYFIELVRKIDEFVIKDSVFQRRLIDKSSPEEILVYRQQVNNFIEKTNIYLKELLEKQIEPHLKTDNLHHYKMDKGYIYKFLVELVGTLENYYKQLTIEKKNYNPTYVFNKFNNLLEKLEEDPTSQAVPEKDASQDAPQQEENNFSPLFVSLPQNLSLAQKEIQNEIQMLRIKGKDIKNQIEDKRYENHMEEASGLFNQELKNLIQDYKRIALLCHPDKWSQASASEKEGAESLFKELTNAIESIKNSWNVVLKGNAEASDKDISPEYRVYYEQLDEIDAMLYHVRKGQEQLMKEFHAEMEEIRRDFYAQILEIRKTYLPHTVPEEVTCRALIIYPGDSDKITKRF